MNVADAIARLIEFNLENYKKMAAMPKLPKGEMDRIEQLLVPIFQFAMPSDFPAAVIDAAKSADRSRSPLRHPLLLDILRKQDANNWSYVEALCGFFMQYRYKRPHG